MKYKGIEQASELELEVKVVGELQDKATYTITACQNLSDDAVSVKLSTEEVIRLRDHLSFILVHNDRDKEWAAKYIRRSWVDNPDNEEINSEDLKCNTCGDYVGEEGVWGLCETCFDKEGGNEALEQEAEEKMRNALSIWLQHTR